MPLAERRQYATLILTKSEEIISLEDELDDPMDIDEAMAAPIVSPLPVRSGKSGARFSAGRFGPTFFCTLNRFTMITTVLHWLQSNIDCLNNVWT